MGAKKKTKGKKKKGKKGKGKRVVAAGHDLIFDPPEDLTPAPEQVDLIVRLANPATEYLSKRRRNSRFLDEGACDDPGSRDQGTNCAIALGRDQ